MTTTTSNRQQVQRHLHTVATEVAESKGNRWVMEMFVKCGGLRVWLHAEYTENFK